MWYEEDLIEEVRSRNDIVDVVSQYVKLTRRGASYFGLCPFHNEKTASFSVVPSKQMYYCFGCGAGGNVFTFLMQYENQTFEEAMQTLASRAGITLPQIEYTPEAGRKAARKQQELDIQKEAARFYYYQLGKSEKGRDYLKKRGLSEEIIRQFGLGWADSSGKNLYRYLRSKGYSDELLRDSGLFSWDERQGLTDRFRERVIFPIMDAGSRVIGFGGRVLGDGKPKYLNSPETEIFDKSRNLYGLHIARRTREDALLVCEGYMDVIAMHQAGFSNAVASLGTALTSGHASLIRRYTHRVLLLYDSDGAGIRAARRAIPILRDAGLETGVVSLSPHKDPDEFIRAEGGEAFRKRLAGARDGFMYLVDCAAQEADMTSPQGQNSFFDQCASLLLELEDELERGLYTEAIVRDYDSYKVRPEDLRRRVNVMAMKGRPQRRPVPLQEETPGPAGREKKENSAGKAQRLMLTWLVNRPALFEIVSPCLTPDDFVDPLYREAAILLFSQYRQGEVNPARLLNAFLEGEDQNRVAALFHAQIPLETEEQGGLAFADSLIRIREDSLRKKQEAADPSMDAMQALLMDRQAIQELKKNRQQLAASYMRTAQAGEY